MKTRSFIWILIICVLIALFSFLALTFEMNNAFSILKTAIFNYDMSNQEHVIILSRVARVLVAILVGAALSLSGFIMQLQYQNDLADPSLMGVSDGSALVIVVSMIFMPQSTMIERMIFSVLGSFFAYLLITAFYRLAFINQSKLSFPLIGIVISMLLNSITTFLVSYFNIAQSVSAWYNSRLYRVSLSDVIYFLPILLILILLVLIFRRQMDVYAYGEALTVALGMNRKRWYRFFSLIVVILTGVSVAIVGRIAFVGLIVPHMVKLVIGKRYSKAVFFVPLVGALIVLISDYLSRYVNYPFETPVGVVIALMGVPIFLFLIRRGAGSQ
ncbi:MULTISPECIES: iron ABC transporter permease [unclassified Enterococcus]|uniref:FecCD family ABC transporter permease n=1 Tax=unclassified Enterococcus TaxID=2608891 RepID=UPI001551973F|nr:MULTISPECIES: iron ABC transporter permease [unclassified Enterococcus]MBS7576757.1 iron ABC transporter permease [Enterococcus sp. MMGLQ5-2]MBS7583756.1 iron ABC transporter permease [Enterococcus sp. MMGLQ5-1]NPD11617.1 iron ABC transporter permease [Enterococcus sp. MMGLQ5-1]NPD36594.1 iron ABC transporter permease [Enterococcus sp. MMGLQ5-2]